MFEYMLRQSERLREACKKYKLKMVGEENLDLVFVKELILGCPVGMQHEEHPNPTVSGGEGEGTGETAICLSLSLSLSLPPSEV